MRKFIRLKSVKLDKPVECCGSPTVIDVNGVYRCPCGQRHERTVADFLKRTQPAIRRI